MANETRGHLAGAYVAEEIAAQFAEAQYQFEQAHAALDELKAAADAQQEAYRQEGASQSMGPAAPLRRPAPAGA